MKESGINYITDFAKGNFVETKIDKFTTSLNQKWLTKYLINSRNPNTLELGAYLRYDVIRDGQMGSTMLAIVNAPFESFHKQPTISFP